MKHQPTTLLCPYATPSLNFSPAGSFGIYMCRNFCKEPQKWILAFLSSEGIARIGGPRFKDIMHRPVKFPRGGKKGKETIFAVDGHTKQER